MLDDYDQDFNKRMESARDGERSNILAAIDEFRSWAESQGRHDNAQLLASVMAYIRRGDHEGAAARALTHEEATPNASHPRARAIEAIRWIGIFANCVRYPVADLLEAIEASKLAPGVAFTLEELTEIQYLANTFHTAVVTLDRMRHLRPVKRSMSGNRL